MRGSAKPRAKSLKAELDESLTLKTGKFVKLEGGVSFLADGLLKVRKATKLDTVNCVMLLPGNRRLIRAGQKVNIHPA